MSWRDRAKPVESGWKARATRVDTTDPLPAPEDDALDALKPDRPLGATMQGVVQGGTLRFGDEIMGAVDTQQELAKRVRQSVGLEDPDPSEAQPEVNPNGPEIRKSWGPAQPAGTAPKIPEDTSPMSKPGLADTYRAMRDGYRADNKTAQKAHPVLHGAGELVTGAALPIPGSGLMKGAPLVAKMGLGGAQAAGLGAAYSLGGSEKEDFGEMRDDALKDAAVAAPFGAGGAALGHGLGKLGERFGGKAKAAETSLRADKTAEMLKSATGTHGHDVQDANRTLFNLKEALANPNTSAATKQKIQAFLASPDGAALSEQVALSSLELAPSKMGDIARSKQAIADAPAMATKFVDDYLKPNTLKADVLPRAAHYAKPTIAAAIGGVAGGPAGAAAGGMLGAASGAPGRAIANLTQKTPRFTIQLNQLLERAANASEAELQRLAIQAGVEVDELKAMLPNQSKPKTLADRFGG